MMLADFDAGEASLQHCYKPRTWGQRAHWQCWGWRPSVRGAGAQAAARRAARGCRGAARARARGGTRTARRSAARAAARCQVHAAAARSRTPGGPPSAARTCAPSTRRCACSPPGTAPAGPATRMSASAHPARTRSSSNSYSAVHFCAAGRASPVTLHASSLQHADAAEGAVTAPQAASPITTASLPGSASQPTHSVMQQQARNGKGRQLVHSGKE